jgi:aminoglycoside phosphotransferase (APT) family kinase protein
MSNPPELTGLSGANLSIVSHAGGIVVRKTAASAHGNERLKKQAEKQSAFIALDGPITAPKILGSGSDTRGNYYFDMEFISGLDGHRFLERCSPRDLRAFADRLVSHLSTLSQLPCIGGPSAHASLFDACLHKLVEVHHRDVGLGNALAGSILAQLHGVRELGIVNAGFCHGDFTLENILIDARGNIYFVDFLDSNFEHPVQDLIKLSQDIHGGWFSIRGKRLSSAVIAYLERTIQPALNEAFPYYRDVRNILQALNFCRILPYVSDQKQKNFVLQRIQQFTLNPP